MKRRDFVASVVGTGIVVPAVAATRQPHDHVPVSGPLANATVSFGANPTDPPFDRMPPVPPPPGPPPNIHQLIPHTTTIRVGGSVNFVIAGLHQVVVYGPGKRPGDVNVGLVIPMPGAPPFFPPVIDDSTGRVYRGLNPFGQPADRVEVVHFSQPGRYLVICAVLPHFQDDNMFGWVRVVSRD